MVLFCLLGKLMIHLKHKKIVFERSDLGCITMTEESAAPDDPTTPEEMTWVVRIPSGRGSRGSSLLIRPRN